jgi:general secretion pathway protein N
VRFDSAGPRTLLLAATATWAVLALLLALFGMGGHIAPLPEDAALLRPLSVLSKPAPERLGPLGQYAEIASRPLFADDRRPHAFSLQPDGGEGQAKAFDYVLTSVMITPTFKMAIIQAPDGSAAPLRIKLGEAHETLPNWRLQALDARSAVFVGPEGERRLDLRVFNGVGGQPPTATTRTNQRPTGEPIVPPPAPAVSDADAVPAPQPAPSSTPPKPVSTAPSPPMTEQAQMDAIRKRIEARRAQLRQEALLEQQRQKQKPPVK